MNNEKKLILENWGIGVEFCIFKMYPLLYTSTLKSNGWILYQMGFGVQVCIFFLFCLMKMVYKAFMTKFKI